MRRVNGRSGFRRRGASRGGSAGGPVERLPADEQSPWWAEHCSRYVYASSYTQGREVLDIASGTGFGTAVLARAGATFVTGCDVSAEEVEHARSRYRLPNLEFVPGDATRLPFANGAFDVVVSMETIEHVRHDGEFLAEVRRVLRADGLLLLSTPNRDITQHYVRNPFHVREYTPGELRSLLKSYFSEVAVGGQALSPRFRIAPFLPGRDKPHSVLDQVRLFAWKVCNRLPFAMKESLARVILGRSFYPSVADYVFHADTGAAHVLVAVCKRG